MKMRQLATLGIAAVLMLPLAASARDTHYKLPIKNALDMPQARSQLDSNIKYYFGDQKHPPVAKDFGEYATNKKTNALNKDDDEACRWVFLSAMLELQERARSLGADGVINIRSNYRNKEFKSNTKYECGAGFLMAGVALKGEFVKFKHK